MARYHVTLSLFISTTRRPTPAVVLEHTRRHLECIEKDDETYHEDDAKYIVDSIAFDGLEPGVDDCDEGNICGGKGWIIVDVNRTGQLRIERCDSCQIMNDAEAEVQPEAQAALLAARGVKP